MSGELARVTGAAMLPRATTRSSEASLEDVAEQFEAVLLKELVTTMRATTSIDGSEPKGGVMIEEMMDDALAGHLAKSGGIGLADYLARIGNNTSLKEAENPPVNAIRSFYASRGR